MSMNYYAFYDAETGRLLAEGTAVEVKRKLGFASIDVLYAMANRSRRGIIKKYRVVIKKGGQTDYPVLGKRDPLYEKYMEEKKNDGDEL